MQKFIGIGRTTKDIELSQTTSGVAVAKFTLAIPRKFKNAEGEKETDFLNCVAWRQSAEIIAKYVNKGDQLFIVGTVQTRTYELKGERKYITEIQVDEFEFIGGNKKTEKVENKDLTEIPVDDLGDNLPF